METDSPLKEGYLLFPPQGMLGHLKKAWHKKYCQLFKASKYGIGRLEVFDNEDEVGSNMSSRIITLENCVKITADAQKHQPNVFVVFTKTSTHHFAAVEENEISGWLSALQSVAFKDDSLTSIEEDNDLYCSSGEGIYIVKLVKSEASARCGLEPDSYSLLLTPSSIQLRDSTNQKTLHTWPYLYIRRYGFRDGKFTFEAGRKCETGEGEFGLEYPNPQEIYKCLSLKMKAMRKLLGNEVATSPAIFCGDNSNQFQAALSMEARSRSPLPPSPTSTTNILELDFNNSTQSSISYKLLTAPSMENITNSSVHTAPPLKPKSISINNLLHAVNDSPPLPLKPKPLISPTVETNPLVIINAPAHLKPKNLSKSHSSLDTISRKSPTLFRAKLVDIDITNDGPLLQPKSTENRLVGPPLKPKPSKPPRKNIFVQNQRNNEMKTPNIKRFLKQNSEPSVTLANSTWKSQTSLPNSNFLSQGDVMLNNNSSSYDEVEFRQDAWKTLGIDEFTHTERPLSHILGSNDSDRDYEVVEKSPEDSRLKEIQNDKMITSVVNKPKYLPIRKNISSGDYDTLQHFGNSSKSNTKSGYKQIVVNNINNSNSSANNSESTISLIDAYTNQSHTFHDYDEVEEPMEACRLADDSHLGYGMIRKIYASSDSDAQSKVDLKTSPKHKVYDNLEYAVVAKPKHV